MDLNGWWSSGLTPKGRSYFIFQDYDGESLRVTLREYKNDGPYFSVDYQGQGPVVLEIDQAKRFIKKWQKMIDDLEKEQEKEE